MNTDIEDIAGLGRGRGPVCSWLWPMERSPQVTAQAAVDTPGVGPQERGDPFSLLWVQVMVA